MVEKAKNACDRAYAPYSGFAVGAALQLDNGEIVLGANQENVAYPSGLCAERVALFAAAVQYPGAAPLRLAVAAKKQAFTPRPVAPCGACRQVLSEVERRYGRPVEILLYGTEEVAVIAAGEQLLPLSFNM